MTDVWVFKSGERVIVRGSLFECAEAWASADGLDYWHGSITYESGQLTYDQQADKLLGVADFMELPEVDWKEPPDLEPMREQARKLGRAVADSADKIIMEALTGK